MEAFRRLILSRIVPEPNSGCWLWFGRFNPDGYGEITRSNHSRLRRLSAHRISYRVFRGTIPSGLQLDHLCRVRCCVNPGHLEPVTPHENWRRGFSTSAINARATHCRHGHPFDARNTYMQGGRRRQCRKCNAAAVAKHKLKKAGAA